MMKKIPKLIALVGLIILCVSMSSLIKAQVTTRLLPAGNAGLNQYGAYGPQAASISRLELPRLNLAQLRAEDQQYQKTGRPLRVAVQQNVNVDIQRAGTIVERNSYRIYQYEVLAPEAGGLSAIFDRLQLAEGARVFLYNAEQTVLIGPITSQQNITNATFTSGHVTGDRLIIELQEPLSVAGQSQLHLLGVANFYEPKGPFGGLRPAGSCENNQACFPTYQSEANGVALILINDGAGGLYICTGATVNDARQSFRSFFLTAFHCIDFNENQMNEPNEANSTAGWTFYFKYQSTTCTPNTDNNTYVTLNGATYRAGSAASDFTLIELNSQAPQSENISFVGWDRSSALASSVFGIHHPNGSLKKISFGGATTTVGVMYGTGGNYNVVAGTSFLQLSWNNGVTEGGSSGSPLFDGTSRRVIGQLLGGGSFCSSPNAPDQYGRFFTSWTGGGASNNRLSSWLDPTGISGNTTNLAVPTVSGPTAFTNTSSFSLNTGVSAITSWSIVGANGAAFSASSGSGNVASLTAIANASNVVIQFTVNAGQGYPIQFTKTFNASVAAPANTPPVATANANQTATVGVPFSYTVNAFTDAETPTMLTYSASIVPPNNLSFNAGTRVISGTPSMSGVSSVTVTASDPGSLSAATTFTITVSPAPVTPPTNTPPVATANANQTATVGVPFSYTVNAFTDAETPTMLTYSASIVPPNNLSFNAGTRVISGTPSMSGVSSVTVTASDPGSLSAATTFTITVSPAPVTPPPTTGPFSITGVTTVSCATVSAGLRTLTFNPQYSGLNGSPVSFSVANEMLPTTAPGPYSLNLYIDNPVITLQAMQSGVSSSFVYNWLVACGGGTPPPPPPTTGTFSITGVTTVSCATVSAGERTLTFNPRYAGLDGSPVSFSVVNELLPTTAPGPYSLRVYTDNPVITLQAMQSGVSSSFAYNWLNACNGGSPGSARLGSEPVARLQATLLPNPVGSEFGVRIEGAQGQSVRLELSDLSGHSVLSRLVDVVSDSHQERLRFGQSGVGLYLLRVSTAQQALTLKVIRE